MTAPMECYEVYAIRYAAMARLRRDNFVPIDAHDGPMPMDFYVWLLRSQERTVLVDTGFNAMAAVERKRNLLRCPIDALRVLGVDPLDITDVILTHLHYDHAGNLGKLPNARFHLQDEELGYATGRCMCYGPLRHAYSVGDIVELVRNVYLDRVLFHDGDVRPLFPGIELMLIGGHTRGLQSVRVFTERGWVVLASDAAHYYENFERELPFPIVYNVADMIAGHRRVLAAADSPEHVVPGHDPQVLARYPRFPADEVGIACLHQRPSRQGR
jgi:glyoxylase-like metal-dependent hydrolase (beta-lactamase superfamily II)